MPETASTPDSSIAWERHELAAGDVTISYLLGTAEANQPGAAQCPTVVILHGLAGSAEECLPTAAAIGPGYRFALIDLRGHGHSTLHPDDASREAYVRDVVAVIEQLDAPEGVALLGHSMGAHTAMLAAAARPDLVRMLVMLEGGVQGSPPEAAARIGAFFGSWPVPFADAAAASHFLGDSVIARAWAADLEQRDDGLWPRFEPAFLQASIAAVHAQSRWEDWEALEPATALVFAPNGMFDADTKDALVEARPATLRVDLGAGSHDAHLDATAEWTAVLRDLLGLLGEGPVRWDWD
jgi:pimeloyl-ACP methyl ester carboxylesterase